MNRTDLAAVELDKKEDEFKATLLKYERNLNISKMNVQIAKDTYQAKFHTATAHELQEYQRVVESQERGQVGAQQAYNSALDAVRTINDEQFGHQKKYAIQYHQLLDIAGDLKADETLRDDVLRTYDEYEAQDGNVTQDYADEKEFEEKLAELIKVEEATYAAEGIDITVERNDEAAHQPPEEAEEDRLRAERGDFR